MMVKKSHIIFAALLIIAIQVGVLHWLGNSWICPCGSIKFWEGAVKTSENSQHLFDWYSFSHLIYGFILYFSLWLVNKKLRWPISVLFLIALAASVGWELFENTKFVVSHYQTQPLSPGYYGDSILNSLLDSACVIAGFLLAFALPVWAVILIAIGLEIAMVANIHDSVILNIVMFIYPSKELLNWQASLSP